MVAFLKRFLVVLGSELRSRARLEAENLVLRQQLVVLSRKCRARTRLRNIDRLLLVWMYRNDHPTAPRSPWQNGHAERLIGAIRHECLDRVRRDALAPNLESLCFLFQLGQASSLLCKDAPDFRSAQPVGNITALPVLGGLHHQYVRV
jgi:Integrase core domain